MGSFSYLNLFSYLDEDTDAGDMVENTTTQTGTNLNLSFVKEFRRRNTRVQGVYGAELFCSIASTREKKEYGWGVMVMSDGASETTTETYDAA